MCFMTSLKSGQIREKTTKALLKCHKEKKFCWIKTDRGCCVKKLTWTILASQCLAHNGSNWTFTNLAYFSVVHIWTNTSVVAAL